MIAALTGKVTRWDEETSIAWVAVSGVTYEVRVPAFAADWIVSILDGDETTIYTYYHVSERNPAPMLVGFQHLVEREFFRKFIEVPDVGPTKAVRALTRPVSEIARWVEAGDAKSLQALPGIGQRLSQTIIARLAGKLTLETLLRDGVEARPEPVPGADLREDAIEALVSLQYSRRDAERAVERVVAEHPDAGTLEALLRAVLAQQAPAGSVA